MINWFVSLPPTNDSLVNKQEKKLADGFTPCVAVRNLSMDVPRPRRRHVWVLDGIGGTCLDGFCFPRPSNRQR